MSRFVVHFMKDVLGKNGREQEIRQCTVEVDAASSCHLVAADQKGARADAPTFASIAARPDFDPAKLAFFLLDPHPKMPNMQLSRDEASDIAAYIATLK